MAYTPFLLNDPNDPEASSNGSGTPTTGGDPTSGGINWDDLMKQYLTNGKGGMSGFLPAVGTALQQWHNSGQYKDLGQQAANVSNPFGDRSYYKDQLRQSYDDPTAVLNNPAHQIAIRRGLDQVAATNAMHGYLGSGNMAVDLSKYASDSDASYLDAERGRLGNLAGAQFDPANAGKFIMEGGKQSIDSQNAALGALATAGMNNSNSPQNSDQSPLGVGSTIANSILNPSTNLVNGILSGSKDIVNAAISAGKRFVSMPDGSTVDLEAMARSGYRTGNGNDGMNYPTPTPGSSYQPDPNYGYGPGDTPGNSTIGDAQPTVNWQDPGSTNWDMVDFNNFSSTDWTNFANYFG